MIKENDTGDGKDRAIRIATGTPPRATPRGMVTYDRPRLIRLEGKSVSKFHSNYENIPSAVWGPS